MSDRASELRADIREVVALKHTTQMPLRAILEAARERLAQIEGGALVIEKVNGEWPGWARVALLETLDGDWVLDDLLLALWEAQMQLVPLPDRTEP